MRIVADASPLIGLAILNHLDLLSSLFEELYLPPAVYGEITQTAKPYAETLRRELADRVKPVQNRLAVELLSNDVDRGEAEAIVLALENDIPDILIDDAKGRRVARLYNLHPLGTIGLLLQAKRTGHITQVKPLLDTLIANKIRIGPALYQEALELAGEVTK